MDYASIEADLKRKIYHPVYFFCGEEAYYIDKLCGYIEENVLDETQKDFNQIVFYGKDTQLALILDAALRYPVMSSHQVIIVKEAQHLEKEMFGKNPDKSKKNILLDYLSNPQKSTILLFCYKYKKADTRTTLGKKLTELAVYFESKKIKDANLPAWIEAYLKAKKYSIHTKATVMLAEYLGNDLGKIAGELDKLMINITTSAEITSDDIEKNIGISKEYNIFELQEALGSRNLPKTIRAIGYFAANLKDNPLIVCLAVLYSFFSKLYIYHTSRDKSRNVIASKMGVSPFYLSDYEKAAKNWDISMLRNAFSILNEYDLKLKGLGNVTTGEEELYMEFVLKLFYLPQPLHSTNPLSLTAI